LATSPEAMNVSALCVYPVKGLRPLPLQVADLKVGSGFSGDREWALLLGSAEGGWDQEHPESLFQGDSSSAPIKASPAAPLWHGSKYNFHQLINSPELARIRLDAYDAEDGSRLKISVPSTKSAHDERLELDARLTTADGREAAERFFAGFLASHGRLKPAKRSGPGDTPADPAGGHGLSLCHARAGTTHQFGNVGGLPGQELVHIVCLPSVRALDAARERKVGQAVEPTDPLQFRANIYLDGQDLIPFSEFAWCGQRIRVGDDVELDVLEPTIRCPASSTHPERGVRERRVAGELRELFPCNSALVGGSRVPLGGPKSRGGFMGVYARVVKAGIVSAGARVEVVGASKRNGLHDLRLPLGLACLLFLGVTSVARYAL